MNTPHTPLTLKPPPDPLADPLTLLVNAAAVPSAADASLRRRLFDRVAKSAEASRPFVTVRRREGMASAPGVAVQMLHAAGPGALRPGEPRLACIVTLAPGTAWPLPARAVQREWLVLEGEATLDATALAPHDFLLEPGRAATLASTGGARLYLRETESATQPSPLHDRGCTATWEDFGPGIRRRLLWQQGSEAAMLYAAESGAAVPHHGHGHDEECLMLEGDLFIDDQLLRPGDYQLAPAGSEHGAVGTDTGALIYVHGDIELDVKAAG